MVLLTIPQTTQAKGCELIKLGTLPVTNSRDSPLTTGELDGDKTKVLIDTGSSDTMVIRAAARRAGLNPVYSPNEDLSDLTGGSAAYRLTLKQLKFGDFVIHNKTVLVANADMGDVGVILGRDILSHLDVEFDLARHRVILWEPKHCEHVALAYWDPKNYLLAKLKSPWFGLNVKVNGRKLDAILDSGTDFTILSAPIAHYLGFDSRKAKQVGLMHGFYNSPFPYYRSRFKVFNLGPMAIKNPNLGVADINLIDMIVGADFLWANRVYLANSQHLVYFTYNGGPVFGRGP